MTGGPTGTAVTERAATTEALRRARARLRAGRAAVVRVVRRVVPPVAFLMILAVWLAGALLDGLRPVLVFDGELCDGPLQLFNPLRRIAAGQRAGAEFQFFHGVGVPYLHYPIFALAGKTIFASELSRQWVNTLSLLIGYLGVFAGATRRLTPTLGLTATALVLSFYLPAGSLGSPGHSLVGVRSVSPLLLVGLLLAGLRPTREAVAAGCLAGVGVLVGTEHGLAAAVMLGLVWAGRRWVRHPGGSTAWAARAAAAFLATWGGLLLLIAGPEGTAKALRYAFLDLPADQFWYFGAPPNRFIHGPTQLADRALWVWAVGPILTLTGVLAAVIRSSPAARPVCVVLIAGLAAGALGAVGYLGYDSPHYLLPVNRMALVVGLIGGWFVVRELAAHPDFAPVVWRAGPALVAGWTVVWLIAGPAGWSARGIPQLGREFDTATRCFSAGKARLAARLEDHLTGLTGPIEADRAGRGRRPPVVWSTYAGLLEGRLGTFHPHTDYIIHAIGPTGRDDYLAGFRAANPDYVVTLRRDPYEIEEWLQNSTWPFYEELVLNYGVRATTKECLLWSRQPGPWRTPDPGAGRVTKEPDGPNWFTVPVPDGGRPPALVVEVEYEVKNPLGRVPVVGGLPRHLLAPTKCRNALPVSLPPYRTSWTFPVFPAPGETPTFYAGTFSLVGGSRLTITRVHVRPLQAGGRDRALWDPGAFDTQARR